jgi:hypothetical protein
MLKFNRIYITLIALTIFIFILGLFITLFDDQLARFILHESEEDDGIRIEWIGFWGNILGSCLQGIATAGGIFVSLQMFINGKNSEVEKEQRHLERVEKESFINSFGNTLNAYDMMIYLVKNYDELEAYYEAEKFKELEQLAHVINKGEVIARVSLMQREISGYKYLREKGLSYIPYDSYQDADGKIRRNMEHLRELLTSNRQEHEKRFSEITGVDLSPEVIWDKGRTFVGYMADGITIGSSVSGKPTVVKSIEEKNKNEK